MREQGFILHCSMAAAAGPSTPSIVDARLAFSRVAGPGWGLVMRGRELRHGGRQGVATGAGGRIHCAWVGYLENRAALLDASPGLPCDASDGELLAAAYARWGAAVASEVVGEYAFALVDTAEGRVVAARSDLGTRRLVWWRSGDHLVVASSAALLLDALPTAPALDDHGVAEFLRSGGLLTGDRTVWSGVRNLAAAHTLVRERGAEPTSHRHWQPSWRPLAPASAAECDEMLRDRLRSSVASAMVVDGTIGVDVSGGLDSSTVAAAAARVAAEDARPLVAYSIVHSPGSDRDESRYQRALCDAYGLERLCFDADAYTDFDALNGDALAEPSTQILQGTRVRAGQAPLEQRGVEVQLSGLGGDQVFCGDGFPPVHLASLLRGAGVRTWARELERWLDRGDRSAFDLIWRWTRAPLGVASSGVEIRPPSWLRPAACKRIQEVRRDGLRRERTLPDAAAEYHWRAMVDIAACAYRCVTPFDMRYPLMSRSIVELVLNLPWSHKVDPTGDRVIQRRAMAGWIPDVIRLRTDKGDVTGRIFEGLRANWSVVRPLTSGERLAALGVVEPGEFRESFARMRHGLVGGSLAYLFGGLALEAWLRLRDETPHSRDPMARSLEVAP